MAVGKGTRPYLMTKPVCKPLLPVLIPLVRSH